MAHSLKTSNVFGIALISAAAGATAALLMAPKSGARLREDIADKARGAKESAKQKAYESKDKLTHSDEE